jgi:hypothetical protein
MKEFQSTKSLSQFLFLSFSHKQNGWTTPPWVNFTNLMAQSAIAPVVMALFSFTNKNTSNFTHLQG